MYLQALEEQTQLHNALEKPSRAATGTPRLLKLLSGRSLAYSEFGDPQGHPLLYCHDQAGSRLEGLLFDESARRTGFRLVAMDRPGLGRSDPVRNTDPTAVIDDMLRVADHLGLERFGLLSWGGGAPYAFLASLRNPARTTCHVALSCPAMVMRGPVSPWRDGLLGLLRLGVQWRCRLSARLRDPLVALSLLERELCSADRRLLADPAVRWAVCRNIGEKRRGNGRYAAQDVAQLLRPWPFLPEELTGVIEIWQGTSDPLASPQFSQWLAARQPGVRLHMLPGNGHFFSVARQDFIFQAARRHLHVSGCR